MKEGLDLNYLFVGIRCKMMRLRVAFSDLPRLIVRYGVHWNPWRQAQIRSNNWVRRVSCHFRPLRNPIFPYTFRWRGQRTTCVTHSALTEASMKSPPRSRDFPVRYSAQLIQQINFQFNSDITEAGGSHACLNLEGCKTCSKLLQVALIDWQLLFSPPRDSMKVSCENSHLVRTTVVVVSG